MKSQNRWVSSAILITALSFPAFTNAAIISGQGTWESTLLGRDLDGDSSTFEAYYDTVFDITWLADADRIGTTMTWAAANSWANGLTAGGHTEWRLPTTVDVDNDGATYTNIYQGVDWGYNITTHSEMSHMFYETLGNLAYYDSSGNGPQSGWGLTNTGPFSNLQSNLYYWSSTESAPFPNEAWHFNMNRGNQSSGLKNNDIGYAWAVHSGDIGAPLVAPVPAAVWLFGSGLLGLIGVARSKA